MKFKLKSSLKIIISVIFIYAAIFLALFYSKDISFGVQTGVYLSVNHIIPSMFIFMVLSNIITSSTLNNYLSLPFHLLYKYGFKISKNEMTIVILSLIGGFPIGARLLFNAVKNNEIPSEKAELMLCYCVNCGPAFLVTFVGSGIMNNSIIGVFLFISQIFASFSVAFILSHWVKKHDSLNSKSKKTIPFSVLIISSVKDSAKALVTVCIFITAFCGIMPVVQSFLSNLSKDFSYLISGILEVTSGIRIVFECEYLNPILLACFFTAFGGICVFIQIAALLHGSGIKMKMFFLMRIPYTFISVLTTFFLVKMFPQSSECFAVSHNNPVSIYTVSPVASIFLILLCIMLLFFCKKNDKIKLK